MDQGSWDDEPIKNWYILEKGHDILLGLRDISHGTLSTLKAYGLELPTMHFTEGLQQKK